MGKLLGVKHLRVVATVYYFGKIFGLLPIKYERRERKNETDTGAFVICKFGVAFWILHFAMEVRATYAMLAYLLVAASNRPKALCAKSNFCVLFTILLSHTVGGLLSVAIVPFRYRRTINVFNKMEELIREKEVKAAFKTSNAVCFYAANIVLKLLFIYYGGMVGTELLIYYYIAFLSPMIVSNIIAVMCLICERQYDEINARLDKFSLWEANTTAGGMKLQYLSDEHWQVTDLLENVSDCFAYDTLLIMAHAYAQIVFFVYMTVWNMIGRNAYTGYTDVFLSIISGALHIVLMAFTIILLAYRSDKVVKKEESTIFHLQRLTSKIAREDTREIAKIFTLRLKYRNVKVTACDFFDIHMGLLINIIGGIFTYFLLLIQLQAGSEKCCANKLSYGNNSTTRCVYWPCLETS